MNAICTQWSIDINVENIHASFIHNYMNSYEMCHNVKILNEIILIFKCILNININTFCIQHIILKRRYKLRDRKNQIVTLYRSYQGDNKDGVQRKSNDVKFLKKMYLEDIKHLDCIIVNSKSK